MCHAIRSPGARYKLGPTTSPLTVSYSMGGSATNGSDYVALSGTAVIPAGSSSVVVTLTPIDDAIVEGDESAGLTLSSGPGYVVGSPALSPDGRTLYATSFDGRLYALDSANGVTKWTFQTDEHVYASPALLEDGRGGVEEIVIASADGSVFLPLQPAKAPTVKPPRAASASSPANRALARPISRRLPTVGSFQEPASVFFVCLSCSRKPRSS